MWNLKNPLRSSKYSISCVVYDKNNTLLKLFTFSYPKRMAHKLIKEASSKIFELVQEMKENIPFEVIEELVANFAHAEFRGATVSILDSGNTIRFSDMGNGIPPENRTAIFEAGFTTATEKIRKVIRGTGSGLFIAQNIIKSQGGTITLDNNLSKGSVFTVRFSDVFHKNEIPYTQMKSDEKLNLENEKLGSDKNFVEENNSNEIIGNKKRHNNTRRRIQLRDNYLSLSERQINILFLASNEKELGPSSLTKLFGLSVSTAFRELKALEDLGLLTSNPNGKRSISEAGIKYLQYLTPPGLGANNNLGGLENEC